MLDDGERMAPGIPDQPDLKLVRLRIRVRARVRARVRVRVRANPTLTLTVSLTVSLILTPGEGERAPTRSGVGRDLRW